MRGIYLQKHVAIHKPPVVLTETDNSRLRHETARRVWFMSSYNKRLPERVLL